MAYGIIRSISLALAITLLSPNLVHAQGQQVPASPTTADPLQNWEYASLRAQPKGPRHHNGAAHSPQRMSNQLN
jgi:hypothetical protein